MEKLKNKEILDATDELVKVILQSDLYQQYYLLQQKMKKNEKLMQQIAEIKKLEQQYVKSDFVSISLKEEIDTKTNILQNIPLYKSYEQALSDMNYVLEIIKTGLNDTFMELLNKKAK